MSAGRIILLNGTSSAGKTTLALAVQRLSATPMHYVSLDQFRDGMCGRFRGMNSKPAEPGARGLNVVPAPGHATELRFGDVGRLTLRGMRRSIAAIATVGLDVVVDDLLLEPSFLDDYLDVLDGFAVTFVGVRCALDVVNERERARPDRFPGTAEAHHQRVHAGCRYDVQVDTSAHPPRRCAEMVLAAADAAATPTAFELMRRQRAEQPAANEQEPGQ